MNSPNLKKSALALAIIALAGAFFWFDLHHYLTLDNIRGIQEQARDFYGQRPLTAIAAFAGVYLLVVALNLPGGALLGLLPLAANRLLGWYHKRKGPGGGEVEPAAGRFPVGPTVAAAPTGPGQELAPSSPPPLTEQAISLASGCTRCGACATRCAFLQEYGLPGEIAAAWSVGQGKVDPFACSLCNLCAALCPEKLEPGDFFLELRRRAAAAPDFDLRPYRPLLSYERLGASSLFAAQSLPVGCRTLFFPGCTLPGTRPQSTRQLFASLQELVPNLGLVLNCCHKPSHDLGRQAYFSERFGALQQGLLSRGVREVVVACPNCYKVFRQYGGRLQVKSAWELLADHQPQVSQPSVVDHGGCGIHRESEPGGLHPVTIGAGDTALTKVTIHDPCPLRHSSQLQQAVRRLAASHGLEVKEMKSSGRRTLCCGEGGAVGRVRPDLAVRWGKMRQEQADGLPVLTYCAGCAGFLRRAGMTTIHLADLLADPAAAINGSAPVTSGPRTYLNRLLCKWQMGRAAVIGGGGVVGCCALKITRLLSR